MQNHTILIPLLILALLLVASYAFEYVMKKLLKVEREKWPSYNHVNDLHRKIDWIIRIVSSIFVFIAFYYYGNTDTPLAFWPFQPLTIFILLLFISESVRAFMEWKYAENPRTYLLTLSSMIFALSLFSLVILTDFFGYL